MIVYHGTTQIIENPDIKYSKKYLDFGPGFYLTSYENQAKKWAFRKGLRQEKPSIINVYELKENLAVSEDKNSVTKKQSLSKEQITSLQSELNRTGIAMETVQNRYKIQEPESMSVEMYGIMQLATLMCP